MKLFLNLLLSAILIASPACAGEIPFIGTWISAEKSEVSDEFIELNFTDDSFTDSAGIVVPYKIESTNNNLFTISWSQESAFGEVERKSLIQVVSPNKILFSWSAGLGDPIEFNRK